MISNFDFVSVSPQWDGEIVDAHQHFWQPGINFHPWLSNDVLIPFRYGDYSAIKRDYLPNDYLNDAAPFNISETVYVETEWNPNDPIGETIYATKLNKLYGLPNAIVAQAWLNAPNVEEVLCEQASFPLVRSIRHKPAYTNEINKDRKYRTLMSDAKWRHGYKILSKLGLHFDLQVSWRFFDEAIRLANDFPETVIILNHTGLPENRSIEVLQGWHVAMQNLAKCNNVMVKISGLGLAGKSWSLEDNAWIIEETIRIFGSNRCMFASNFPVDRLCGTFFDIFSGFKVVSTKFTALEQKNLFCETARKIYKTSNFSRKE